MGPSEGAVAADDHQSIKAKGRDLPGGPRLPCRRHHLPAAGRAEHRAPPARDAVDVRKAEFRRHPLNQPGIPPLDTHDDVAPPRTGFHQRADGRIHTRGVTARSQDSDAHDLILPQMLGDGSPNAVAATP